MNKRKSKEPAERETAVRSMCIVCGGDFTSQLREDKNFPELWSKIWTAFCTSLDLNPSSWTEISSFYSQIRQVPFCDAGECRRKIITLFTLREQLEGIREQISKVTNNISMTIINTHTAIRQNPKGNSLNLNRDQNNDVSYLNVKKETEKLRNKLTQRFFPNLVLTRVQLPDQVMEFYMEKYSTLLSSPEMSDSEPEADFLRGTSDESESESELESKSQSQSSIPVNMNKSKRDERGSTYLYKDKWPVKSLDVKTLDSKARFKCLTCGRVRVQRGHLEAHIRKDHIHSSKFHCKICGKDLKYYGTFVSHMRLHRATSVSSLVSLTAAPSRVLLNRKTRNSNQNQIQQEPPKKRIMISKEKKKEPKSDAGEKQLKSWLYMNKYPVTRLKLIWSGESPRFQCGICDQVIRWNHGIIQHIRMLHMYGETLENCPNNSLVGIQPKSQREREIETNSIEKYCAEQNFSFKEGSDKFFLYRGKWPIQILGNGQNKNGYRCRTCGFTATLAGVAGHIRHKHLESQGTRIPKDESVQKSSSLAVRNDQKKKSRERKATSSSSSSSSFLFKGKWSVTKRGDSNGKSYYKCDSCGFIRFDQAQVLSHIENEHILKTVKLVPY